MTTIARRNPSAPHSRYLTARRPGWTWAPPVRQHFHPFATLPEQLILAVCVPLMLALFIFMAHAA